MDEVYWFGYVGFFLLPFCAVCVAIYLEDMQHKRISALSVAVLVTQIVPHVEPQDAAPSAPTAKDTYVTEVPEAPHTKQPERPPPPPYPSVYPSLYPDPHAASAAKMQASRIYIRAVGLR